MWRKGNPCTLLMGMQIGIATMEKSMQIPQKIKIEQRYYPEISPVGIYPNEMKTDSQRDIRTPMFTEASFKTTKIWKQSKIWCLCVYMHEYVCIQWDAIRP